MRKISASQLRAAVERAGLPSDAFERIQAALEGEAEVAPNFEAAHISYYLGALLIIGAMGWFVTNAWDRLSGLTLSAIAIAYAVLFGTAGVRLFRRAATRIPGGLLTAVAVCMTPMAVYGLEHAAGWWSSGDPGSYSNFHPFINGSWVVMECATVLVAAAALKFVRFPFITAPAAYALWYLSMDATAWIFGKSWTFHQQCWISVIFGLAMLIAAYFMDGAFELDFAFWFYLFGLLTFSGGLSLMGTGSQLGRAVYCLIHLAMMALAVLLRRRVFLVFGAIGAFAYLVQEANEYFRNSFGFTVALTLIGIAFIVAGIAYKRNEAGIAAKLSPFMPSRVRQRHADSIA
ncbi:MAG: hypothetical protein WBE72_10135 [Terracidiphilus sp.]